MEEEVDKSREGFQNAIDRNEDEFEKKITYISAGALLVSITFLDKIVKLDDASFLWVISLGWTLLGLSLLLNLASLLLGANYSSKGQEEYDNFIDKKLKRKKFNKEQKIVIDKIKSRNKIMTKINWGSYSLLVIGIISVVVFASINVHKNTEIVKQKNMKKENLNNKIEKLDITERGKTTPIPKSQSSNSSSNNQQSNSKNK